MHPKPIQWPTLYTFQWLGVRRHDFDIAVYCLRGWQYVCYNAKVINYMTCRRPAPRASPQLCHLKQAVLFIGQYINRVSPDIAPRHPYKWTMLLSGSYTLPATLVIYTACVQFFVEIVLGNHQRLKVYNILYSHPNSLYVLQSYSRFIYNSIVNKCKYYNVILVISHGSAYLQVLLNL